MSERNFIFTDAYLDGIGCLMLAKWCLGSKTPYITTTVTNFRENLLTWLQNHKLTDYDNVYITDLDVSQHADLLDHKNVTIIDHHLESYDEKYKNAKIVIDVTCTSATKLTFQHFIAINPLLRAEFTKPQLKFITLVDDYDSYTLKHSETVGLNVVLWSMTGDRVQKFTELYQNGFVPFNREQINMINIAQKRINDAISPENIYIASLPIGKKQAKVMSVFCDHNINEVGYEVINRYGVDICFIVNLRTKSVSFRRSKECDINVAKLAKVLCNGGGHASAAGGKLTDEFLSLSKRFTNYEVK